MFEIIPTFENDCPLNPDAVCGAVFDVEFWHASALAAVSVEALAAVMGEMEDSYYEWASEIEGEDQNGANPASVWRAEAGFEVGAEVYELMEKLMVPELADRFFVGDDDGSEKMAWDETHILWLDGYALETRDDD